VLSRGQFRKIAERQTGGLRRILRLFAWTGLSDLRKAREDSMTIDEKWTVVKEFYETSYRIKFAARIDDEKIEILWNKMKTLQEELHRFYSEKPFEMRKVLQCIEDSKS
jgi:hypothetical protein